MSLPLSKLPPGVLNEKVREKVPEVISTKDGIFDAFRSLLKAQFGNQYSIVNSEFTGVCIQILEEEEKQKLVTAGAFEKVANTSKKKLKGKKACRVFIPEIHNDRVLPDDIYNPSEKDKAKMKAFFPIFVSDSDEIASKSLLVGHLVKVKIKNENGAGVYFDIVGGVNSSINIYNENPPSAKSFKCDLFRFSRIVNSQGRSISSGQVLTEEKEQSSNKINEASLKQQYKKYLAEKEMYWYRALKNYWKPVKFVGLINTLVEDSDIFDVSESQLNNIKKLFWLLLKKLSALSPTGITNTGLTVLNVDSISDSYGIFKHTKSKFDEFQLNFESDMLDSGGDLNLNDEKYNEMATNLFVEQEDGTGGAQHSDLLDPYLSMQFFILDFINYIGSTASDIVTITTSLFDGTTADNKSIKKIVTNYFTANDKKIDFLFTDDYKIIANQFMTFDTGANSFSENDKNINDRINLNSSDSNPPAYFSFESWLTEAGGGAAVEIGDFIKEVDAPPDNSQLLEQDQPTDTKDECHENYAQRNTYLEHVDAQKKIFRQYIESTISGEELSFLASRHVGVHNVIISDLKVKTPFKVIRFDGNSGFLSDKKRWFNSDNNRHLIYDKNYQLGYYRKNTFISKALIGVLNIKKNLGDFYKTNLDLMYNLNKPVPHFLIEPNGQIIQLIDVAAAVDNGLDNTIYSVNISFVNNIGDITPFEGSSNTALNNYILVNTDPEESIYRPHKIGTQAALEAAHKLIQFLMTQTNIKYNVAAQDFKLTEQNSYKSGIQAYGHYKGISGMNFIYYAWTYGLAFKNGGTNIRSINEGYN